MSSKNLASRTRGTIWSACICTIRAKAICPMPDCSRLKMPRPVKFAHRATAGIEFENFTGLGLFNREQSGIGQMAFARIVQMQADQIVPRVRDAKFLDDIAPG